MSVRAVLHVGMPKCGSSALQAALSASPELAGRGGPAARYLAIHASGELVGGAELGDRALQSATGYVVSARAAQIEAFGALQRARVSDALVAEVSDGARAVFSNEGWGNEYAAFAGGRLLERLGIEAEIVLYVRAQVGWCNSAWWQWGAWNQGPFQRWLAKQFDRIQWSEIARRWQAVPGVAAVRVRLLPTDIVGDFCARLGVHAPPGAMVNASLSAPVLRLMQRHRELRRGPHDSALEFVLGRHLQLDAPRAPWVLTSANVEAILEGCRASNERLPELLDDADRERMRADPAWWSADPWLERAAENRRPGPADGEETDALAAAALQALFRLDASHRETLLRCRRLEREIAGLRGGTGGLLARLRRMTGPG